MANENERNMAAADTANDLLQLVTFGVGTEEFAVPILAVREINRVMALTRMPQCPPSVEGVVNLRGTIVPVVDLRSRFGLSPGTDNATEDQRVIVVEVRKQLLGFRVDRVSEVLRIDRNIVEPAPAMTLSIGSEYVNGIAKLENRLLILLDLERLFTAGGNALPAAA